MSWGFDHWWGFLSGAAGQYDPIITQDNSTLGVPEGTDGELYYFPDDLTDKAVEWLHAVRAQDAPEAVDDVLLHRLRARAAPRRQGVGRQVRGQVRRRLGPAARDRRSSARRSSGSSRPTPSSPSGPRALPAWDSLTDAQKKLYARQMEVFAGFQENADWNVGRLLDAIEEMGDLENTLIFYIWGDNGAEHGGHDHRFVQRDDVPQRPRARRRPAAEADREVRRHRGARRTTTRHRTIACGLGARRQHAVSAGASRCRSHLGGTRNPMVVAWPSRLKRRRDDALAVHPLHRHRPDRARGGRAYPSPSSSTASSRSRWTARASSTPSRTRRPRSATRCSTSRCSAAGRIYKDGWWAALEARPRMPWDFSPDDDRPVRPRGLGSRTRTSLGALLPARRLLAGPRPGRAASGEGRRAPGSVVGGGRTQPRAAADGRACRSSSASCRRYRRSLGCAFAGDVQNIQRGMTSRGSRGAHTRSRRTPPHP